MYKILKEELAGIPIVAETGKIAKQADGAIILTYGETSIIASVCCSKSIRDGIDFFPLIVEYREKMCAAGKIPGGFFKREGRPSTEEILRSRIVDRSVRPLFPDGFRNEVQIIISTLSYDQKNVPDVMAVNAASLALSISSAPFQGPVSAVRIAKIEGEIKINPTEEEIDIAEYDMFFVGLNGRINMIEAGGREISEEEFLSASKIAIANLEEMQDFQTRFIDGIAKEKMEFEPPVQDEKILATTREKFTPILDEVFEIPEKIKRQDTLSEKRDKFIEDFLTDLKVTEDDDEYKATKRMIKDCIHDVEYDHLRSMVLTKKLRTDGRGLDEVRDLFCETRIFPRTHGTAIFQRGETQALATVTLGTKRDEQIVDSLRAIEKRRSFMLHYTFPPFSVGEARPIRGVSRREIGHGALAEKAIQYVLPSNSDFPYTIRLVSDIMESNGSSSMASVCAGSLSLMDAGVPIKKHCAGIAMGMISDENSWEIITDIAGIEDHSGDMDFKVAGTIDGITACQLDVKCLGITPEQIEKTLSEAKKARLHILKSMESAISEPSDDMSDYAPRITTIMVEKDQVREIIGPGGKIIKQITADSGATVEIEDDGTVNIISNDRVKMELARTMIENIVKTVEAGEEYDGKVMRVMNFGAFVEILPGKEGLVHISELEHNRVEKVEDVINVGDAVRVKVLEIDNMGRINLSRKALLDKPEGYVEPERKPREPRSFKKRV